MAELTEAEKQAVSAKVKDAFYEARDQGRTMHQAAEDERIAAAVEQILAAREAAWLDRLGDERVVEVASREMFWADDLGQHHKPGYQPHTWDNIPEVGRENYRTGLRAALAAVRAELLRQGGEE